MSKKISQLGIPTLPLSGSDLFEMEQSGDSIQVSLDELLTNNINLGDLPNVNTSGETSQSLLVSDGTNWNASHLVSTNGLLAGNSDLNIPTEKAVKTYVDSQIASGDEHNELLGKQGGDSTTDEFYHLTQAIHNGLFSASPSIGLGDPLGTRFVVDYGTGNISAVGDIEIDGGLNVTGVAGLYIGTQNTAPGILTMATKNNVSPLSDLVIETDGSADAWNIYPAGKLPYIQIVDTSGPDQLKFGASEIYMGIGDSRRGFLTMYASDSGNQGAEIVMHVPPDYDTIIETYAIQITEDDLQIGPITNPDSLIYNGGTNSWVFSASGGVTIGEGQTSATEGVLNLEADNSNQGGTLNLFVGAGYDTTIDFYQIRALQDDLQIGPSTDLDALKYDGGAQSWIMSPLGGVDITTGNLRVGVDDSQHGELFLYADDGVGAKIYLFNNVYYHGTIDRYMIQTEEDDLLIGPVANTDALKYDGATNGWIFSAAAGVTIGEGQAQAIGGVLNLEADNSNQGGVLNIFVGAGYDTTIDSYQIRALNDDLQIGPSTDLDSLKYDGGSNTWQFTAGVLDIGIIDSKAGTLSINSDNYGNAKLLLFVGGYYDTTIDFYRIGLNNTDANLEIGPSTNPDALIYNSATNGWVFSSASGVTIGEGQAQAIEGVLNLEADNSNQGGTLNLFVGAGYDTTIDFYQIRALQDDLQIGPATDPDALKYDGGAQSWILSPLGGVDITTGDLRLGADDSQHGEIFIYGDDGVGSRIHLFNDIYYDGTIDKYMIQTDEDDLWIGPEADLDALKYEGDTNKWIASAAGGFDANTGLAIGGTNVDATAVELNTKEFMVHIPDLSDATAEVSFVSSVAGTVTQVYSSVEGDPGGDTIISGNVNGGANFSATMTIANSSAQHDVDSMTPADNNTITAGQTVRFITDGGALKAVGAWLTVVITL